MISLLFCLLALPIGGIGLSVGSQGMDSALSASVAIELQQEDEWTIIGSGTVIRKRHPLHIGSSSKYAILTAYHIAKYTDDYKVRACSVIDRTICVLLGSYQFGDESLSGDWALVNIPNLPTPLKPAQTRHRKVCLGDEVFVVGHPWGDFLLSTGILGRKHKVDFWVVHSYAAPGSSGGGIFDRRGRLIGSMVAIAIEEDPWGVVGLETDLVYMVPIQAMVW